MNIPIHYQPSPWRYLWLLLLIGLPILGWHGVLDDFSSQDINHSITNAGLIYGTARGINALVSVLQGTEVNVLVMTFSIGEVLDPVNDLIERFSEFVLWLSSTAKNTACHRLRDNVQRSAIGGSGCCGRQPIRRQPPIALGNAARIYYDRVFALLTWPGCHRQQLGRYPIPG